MPCLLSFLLSSLPYLPPHPFSSVPLVLCHPSIRSWRSVSAIITMQSCSLSERLTARASRRSNSSQNKSCKHSALNWRTRAKPCWVSVCVGVGACIRNSPSHNLLAHFTLIWDFWSQSALILLWKPKSQWKKILKNKAPFILSKQNFTFK